jgi:hypothetical protein
VELFNAQKVLPKSSLGISKAQTQKRTLRQLEPKRHKPIKPPLELAIALAITLERSSSSFLLCDYQAEINFGVE